MSRHLIVISNDAMVYEDIETLRRLPGFSAIWDKTARVNRMRSVYPTITYPCHATMMTGVYPETHGIVNNEQAIPGETVSKWVHFRESVKAKTIFDYAKEAGFTTAAVYWPVTGNDPNIDYLVNEFWPQDAAETDEQCFARSGSSPEVMRTVVRPNLGVLRGKNRIHPYTDNFIMSCASAIIREYKPDLLMIHPAQVDSYRHQTGVFSEKVTYGLYETDHWFTDLVKATRDAGIYEDTDFVFTSDHGQMNIVRLMSPNVILAENGLIETDPDGRFIDYKAWIKSGALSAQVYLKDPNDRAVYDKTYALLKDLCAREVYGISRVFTAEEARAEEHLAGAFSFVLESDGYTSFTNDWRRPLVRSLDPSGDYRFGRATHGYLPAKGPQPTMFGFGPHICAGAVIERCLLVDQAPTFARILGLDMKNTDGSPIAGFYME